MKFRVQEAESKLPSAREARAPSTGQCKDVNRSVNIPRMPIKKLDILHSSFPSSCPLAIAFNCAFVFNISVVCLFVCLLFSILFRVQMQWK